jgi:hypothetical protein
MANLKTSPAYDWSGYVLDAVNGDPFFHVYALSPCDNYNRKTKSFSDNKEALLAAVAEAEGRKVSVIHSLFLVDPAGKKTSIIGALGTKKNAPFKSVLVGQVIKPMTSS